MEERWDADGVLPLLDYALWARPEAEAFRRAALDQLPAFRAARDVDTARRMRQTVVLPAPPSYESLRAEALRGSRRANGGGGARDVVLSPLHDLAWAEALVRQKGRSAIEDCNERPAALDHDHRLAGGTGFVRGALCAIHNHTANAPSGPDAVRRAPAAMRSYLETGGPMADLRWTYVDGAGYPDGWSAPGGSEQPPTGLR